MATTEIIKAAGGIIERCTQNGIEIAIIHRTRYGSEWCLPKGKLETGESWEAAATREVLEETGLICAITGSAGLISYLVKNTPKLVQFYRMSVSKEQRFKPNDEVDKVDWLTPEAAISRLQHEEEIELLTRTYNIGQLTESIGACSRFLIALRAIFQSRRKGRLASSVAVYRQELHRRALTGGLSNEAELAISEAFRLLLLADRAVRIGDIDNGWKCFLGAQRMEIFSFSNPEDLQLRAKLLREESQKLSMWRKAAVDTLLGTNTHPKDVTDAATIYEATLLRDEHYSNEAYKSSLKRDYNLSLIAILSLVILTIFLMLKNDILILSDNADQHCWQMIASVAIFGLLGGVVSAITREMDVAGKPSKIPEIVTAIRVTLLRIFVGAAFALVAYLLMQSQLTQVFDETIANAVQDLRPYTIYAVSFISGFTERIVLRAVGVVTGKE